MVLACKTLGSIHPMMLCACQIWMKLAQLFLRKSVLHLYNVFWFFCNYLHLKKGMILHLNKLESPSPRILCTRFGWNWPNGSWEDEFKISSMYFRYFIIISTWERTWTFIWTNLNSLYLKMRCVQFSWNLPSDSGNKFL